MKIFILISLPLLLLTGCSLEEAKPLVQNKIIICTDTYSKADSLLVKKLSSEAKIKIELWYLSTQKMDSLIAVNKYNVPFDILLTHSESVRKQLLDSNLLSKLNLPKSFNQLNRQFYNTHHFWLPIFHNPLILSKQKDSTENCSSLNWQKIKNDSLPIGFKVREDSSTYLKKIASSKRFSPIKLLIGQQGNLYTYHQLAEYIQRKPNGNRACLYYVLENKKYLTKTTSISLYRFSRNKDLAHQIIVQLLKHRYQLANNHNQLSTFKNIPANYSISTLNIR